MNIRYLAALATLVLLGFSVPAAAHPCEDPSNLDHKHCKDRGGNTGGKSSDLYKVEVFFWQELFGGTFEAVGDADHVEGSGNQKRQSIGDVDPMDLDLTQMIAAMDDARDDDGAGEECAAIFAGEISNQPSVGEFTIGTARLDSKSDKITYVTAAFWNFTVAESNFFLVFGPDGDGWIGPIENDVEGANWPPGEPGEDNSNFLSGFFLELQVTSGPAKTTSCHRLKIELDWKIDVTKESV